MILYPTLTILTISLTEIVDIVLNNVVIPPIPFPSNHLHLEEIPHQRSLIAMRFRQVHLDFHTSEHIPGIGSEFSKEQFQRMLKLGHVNSITVFSKCHHGWSYHPTEASEMHPQLDFDLLGAMIEAAHEIDVRTPVYISAGLDEKLARRYPQWLTRNQDESIKWTSDFMRPGYHEFCMNTPYLDILVAQIEEVVQRYDADGIFLDIVGIRECYCQNCVTAIREAGAHPQDLRAMRAMWEQTYLNYAKRTNDAVHKHKPNLPVFHNGGHIEKGRRDLANLNTHLELESLPTGGWGYDHFPLSARYAQPLGMDFLGMTGKFHLSWGEFGGYKHPNALRYETALSLANGARCSVGDQLHPAGFMDEATYTLIGAAYQEVEAKEPWVVGAQAIADIGLLSMEALLNTGVDGDNRVGETDSGAVRMLLEGKFLFHVLDFESDFQAYKVIILPDRIVLNPELRSKLEQFTRAGGKLLATGQSGLLQEENRFAFNLGAQWISEDPYQPSYFHPRFPIAGLPEAAYVMYSPGQKIALMNDALSHGERRDPYFNRDLFSFSSHVHTPYTLTESSPAMTEGEHGIYFAWNVFEEYGEKGSLVLREAVCYALNRLLPSPMLRTNLPAQGVVTLQKQEKQHRWINHLLYASPVRRGKSTEIIEDIVPLFNIEVEIRVPQTVKSVTLAPTGEGLAFEQQDGSVRYVVPELCNHQMVVLQF